MGAAAGPDPPRLLLVLVALSEARDEGVVVLLRREAMRGVRRA